MTDAYTMADGYYWKRFDSYGEHGPFRTFAEAEDAGVEGTWYSRDFHIQRWLDGNLVSEVTA